VTTVSLRSAAEVVIGMLYAIGAGFNTVYTLRHGAEFYGDFAENAWLRPARSLTRHLIVPNATVFTVGLILFQPALAFAILTRTDMTGAALIAGGSFALVVAFFSSPGGTVGNLILAGIQLGLAWS